MSAALFPVDRRLLAARPLQYSPIACLPHTSVYHRLLAARPLLSRSSRASRPLLASFLSIAHFTHLLSPRIHTLHTCTNIHPHRPHAFTLAYTYTSLLHSCHVRACTPASGRGSPHCGDPGQRDPRCCIADGDPRRGAVMPPTLKILPHPKICKGWEQVLSMR